MKKHTQIFAAGVVLAMLLSLGACSVTVDKPDEGVIPTEVIEATAVPDPEAEPLTEEELLPYLEFHDLFVRQMDEPIEVFEDTGGNKAEEPTEGGDAGEADTDSGGEEAPEAEIEDTGGEETTAEDETTVLDENKDPMGYVAAITKYYEETVQNEVIRNISYDSTTIDVTVTGEYEITYIVTVDRDAYDAALLVDGKDEGGAETEDVALEPTEGKDEYYVEDPSTEVLDLENTKEVTIAKTVFVIDKDVFDEMATTEGSVVVNDWLLYTTVDVESEDEGESDAEVADEADVSNNSKSDSAASVNNSAETKNEDASSKVSGNNNSTSGSNSGSTSNSGGNGSGGTGGSNSTNNSTATAKPTVTAKPTATATPTPTPHVHSWTTKTVSDGYYETVQTGTQSVDNGSWKTGTTGYRCNGCGQTFAVGDEGNMTVHILEEMTSYSSVIGNVWVSNWSEKPVYEDVWVDTSYTQTICSICGAIQ